MSSKNKIIYTSCLTALLWGCGTLPASGPYGSKIKDSDKVSIQISSLGQGNDSFRYAVADIDASLLKYLAKNPPSSKKVTDWPANKPAADIKVNVGDTIQVSIFESQSGGLFIPADSAVRPGNFVSLPPQTIDSEGIITVPYAGEIQVAGKSTEEISADIVARLENKAIEPQVVVSVSYTHLTLPTICSV